ncbi:MAG: hypothetical protein WCY11_10410 [Novosphingobium sp.]
MTEHEENIAHARKCVSAISRWLSILADYCDERAIIDMEAHLAEISRGLDRLSLENPQHPN